MDFTTLTPQQIADFAKPCNELEELLKNKPPPKTDWSDPPKVLSTFRSFIAAWEKTDELDPELEEENLQVPTRDGFIPAIRVFRPKTPGEAEESEASTSPLIVLYFPGGFVLGCPTVMANIARAIAKRFNAVVVAPDYRLAPENPFPIGINDGWDTLSWIARNSTTKLRADPTKGFIVGGISSGGGISNVVAHLARDTGLQPPLTGVWLSCAGSRLASNLADQLPEKYQERHFSRTQEACIHNSINGLGMSTLIRESLKPDLNSKLYAPLIWPTEDGHKGFPKTYSQICGMDPSRDEGLIFDDMLKAEGVKTRLNFYPGLPHTFWIAHKDLPQSKGWEKDVLDGFAWLLED